MWPRRQLSWVPYKTVAKCKPDEGEIFVNVIMILVNVYASMMQRGGCSTHIKLCVYPRANSTISEWEVKYALETTDNLAFYCFCVSEFVPVWYWLRVWTVTSQDEGRALSFLLLSFWCCSSCGYCSSFADIALPGDVVHHWYSSSCWCCSSYQSCSCWWSCSTCRCCNWWSISQELPKWLGGWHLRRNG